MARRTPDNSEILFGLGIIALLALCPPLGVLVVLILVFSTK